MNLKTNNFLYFDKASGDLYSFSELGSLVEFCKPHTQTIVEKVLSLAEAERKFGNQDFKEIDGQNKGPQIKKYFNEVLGIGDGQAWCAVFVSWVLMKNGINMFKTADTWEIERIAKEKGILSDVPGEGDVFLVMKDGHPTHTGFVIRIDPSDTRYILSIEGNAGDSIKVCNDKLIKNLKFVKWQNIK